MQGAEIEGTDTSGERPRRRRLPGVDLRPGSVKQARAEAGLSLAEVGRGHVTAPAIYLIETGRTRPSLPTLEHIAKRTGKPIAFFLAERFSAGDDGNVRFLQLEAMVEEHRDEEAVPLGLALLEDGPSAVRLGRIRYLLAYAYEGLGQRDQALSFITAAKQHFAAINDSVMLAACIAAEAEFNVDTDPKRAVALAEEGLALARSLTPRPLLTAARMRGILADAQAASGDLDGAIATYRDAINFTEPVFDLGRVARTYRGLAQAFEDAGELEKASRYALRATAIFEIVAGRQAVIRWEHRLARALIARGDAAEARVHLDRALDFHDRASGEGGRADVLLGLCELALHDGNLDEAADYAQEALAQAERANEPASAADAHVWLGQIAERRGDAAAADAKFGLAIEGYEALNVRERGLYVHTVYAELLERRGDHARAYEHMKRALRLSRVDPGTATREGKLAQGE